jgi:hypothetical protein
MKDKEEFLIYTINSEVDMTIVYGKEFYSYQTFCINTKHLKVPLDEPLLEGLRSQDKTVRDMTFIILKNKYEKS